VTGQVYGAAARSFLFVPGTRPDRFAKAAASGADAVILDLEDAVAPQDKADARALVADHVGDQQVLVRVNGAATPWFADDLAALAGAGRPAGIVLPKAESPEQVAAVVAALGRRVPIFALIESARGVRDANLIAQTPGVTRVMFGNLDFALDSGINVRSADERELLFARSALVIASRAAGLPGPVDGVQPDIVNDAATGAAARSAVDLGFTGKLCIHPRQIPLVHSAFEPSADELRWAARVLESAGDSGGGAARLDGEMIDAPRLELARRIAHSDRKAPAGSNSSEDR
jgi:citrate lyase subunit beta / citryl-CoA lyase